MIIHAKHQICMKVRPVINSALYPSRCQLSLNLVILCCLVPFFSIAGIMKAPVYTHGFVGEDSRLSEAALMILGVFIAASVPIFLLQIPLQMPANLGCSSALATIKCPNQPSSPAVTLHSVFSCIPHALCEAVFSEVPLTRVIEVQPHATSALRGPHSIPPSYAYAYQAPFQCHSVNYCGRPFYAL